LNTQINRQLSLHNEMLVLSTKQRSNKSENQAYQIRR